MCRVTRARQRQLFRDASDRRHVRTAACRGARCPAATVTSLPTRRLFHHQNQAVLKVGLVRVVQRARHRRLAWFIVWTRCLYGNSVQGLVVTASFSEENDYGLNMIKSKMKWQVFFTVRVM